MKLFEKIIIGLLSFSVVLLFSVAIDFPNTKAYQSPKGSFSATIVEKKGLIKKTFDPFESSKVTSLRHLTAGSLSAKFMELDYNLANVINEGVAVPRILVVNMPREFRRIQETANKKDIFFKTVLPLVLTVNEEILSDRKRLLRIIADKIRSGRIRSIDKLWLVEISEKYFLDTLDLAELLRRVDIIPPSLALAQAAEESGWGTSRFAVEGNALFGQYTYQTSYSLIPRKREKGKDHNIRAFASLLDAVRSYARNLNTHRAYREFRNRRHALRRSGREITGKTLASKLKSYSERGEKYIRTIKSIMRANRLNNLDKAIVQKSFFKKKDLE